MRLIINILILLALVFVTYVLISSIREPIEFEKELGIREKAVIARLQDIRKAQEFHRAVAGSFAGTFDELKHNLQTKDLTIITAYGDPDDPESGEVFFDTIRKPAIDSIRSLNIRLDSLEFIPFGEGAVFSLKVDTIPYEKTTVNVLEVGAVRKDFMGKYGDVSYRKYDDKYDPGSSIKFGDLNKPSLTGTWER